MIEGSRGWHKITEKSQKDVPAMVVPGGEV